MAKVPKLPKKMAEAKAEAEAEAKGRRKVVAVAKGKRRVAVAKGKRKVAPKEPKVQSMLGLISVLAREQRASRKADGSPTKSIVDSRTKNANDSPKKKRNNAYNTFRRDYRLKKCEGGLKERNKLVAGWYAKRKEFGNDWDKLMAELPEDIGHYHFAH